MKKYILYFLLIFVLKSISCENLQNIERYTDSGNQEKYTDPKKCINPCILQTIGVFKTPGDLDGSIDKALLSFPVSTLKTEKYLYIVDRKANKIKILEEGIVKTFAGTGEKGYRDGVALEAQFDSPSGISMISDGSLIVSEVDGNRIRKISPSGIVTTLAGTGEVGYQDGPGNTAKFFRPSKITTDEKDNTFVADFSNASIRMIDKHGYVTTIAYKKTHLISDEDSQIKGTPLKWSAKSPSDVRLKNNSLYISDWDGNSIWKVDPGKQASIIAGSQTKGDVIGDSLDSRFFRIGSIDFDSEGNLLIADSGNYKIKKMNLAQSITTILQPPGLTNNTNALEIQTWVINELRFRDNYIYIIESGVAGIRRITTKNCDCRN